MTRRRALRAAFCLAVPVALALGALPWTVATFALLAALLAAAAAAIVSVGPRLPPGLARALDVGFTNLCVVLVATELLVRALPLFVHSPLFAAPDAGPAARVRESRLPPGLLKHGFPINRRGDDDDEPGPRRPGVRRVVAIGDSFSCSPVPRSRHFTTVAEGLLPGVEVYNMGAPTIGPEEYLYLLRREAPSLAPDLVVVDLFVGNDVSDVRAEGRSWVDRFHADAWRTATVLRRVAVVLAARAQGYGASWDGAIDLPRGPAPLPAGLRRAYARLAPDEQRALMNLLGGDHGRTVALLLQRPARTENVDEALTFVRGVLRGAAPQQAWFDDVRLEPPTMSRAAFVEREAAYAANVDDRGNDFAYRRLYPVLDAMRAAAGATPLALMLIPAPEQLDDDLWAAVQRRWPARPLERDRPQRLITAWARARGVAVLDLLPALRAAPPSVDGTPHLFHRNDPHFNVRGNLFAGRALADFLRTQLTPGR